MTEFVNGRRILPLREAKNRTAARKQQASGQKIEVDSTVAQTDGSASKGESVTDSDVPNLSGSLLVEEEEAIIPESADKELDLEDFAKLEPVWLSVLQELYVCMPSKALTLSSDTYALCTNLHMQECQAQEAITGVHPPRWDVIDEAEGDEALIISGKIYAYLKHARCIFIKNCDALDRVLYQACQLSEWSSHSTGISKPFTRLRCIEVGIDMLTVPYTTADLNNNTPGGPTSRTCEDLLKRLALFSEVGLDEVVFHLGENDNQAVGNVVQDILAIIQPRVCTLTIMDLRSALYIMFSPWYNGERLIIRPSKQYPPLTADTPRTNSITEAVDQHLACMDVLCSAPRYTDSRLCVEFHFVDAAVVEQALVLNDGLAKTIIADGRCRLVANKYPVFGDMCHGTSA